MLRLYEDVETCGLHSMPVLIQHAVEEGPIQFHHIWHESVADTLKLLAWMAQHTVVGFNIAFDWYHINKLQTIWSLLPTNWLPVEHIEEIAMLEPAGRDQAVIKPAACLDLLLHSRKGPYQSLMAREDIRIRKVPAVLADGLARELEERVQIDGLYFAKSANPDAPKWKVDDRKDRDGQFDPEWKDVRLSFKPAGGLKYLAEHALGIKPKAMFDDIGLPKKYNPYELGWAPYALAVSSPDKGWAVESEGKETRYAWPALIHHHIDHWATNERAQEYARDDIDYTRGLERHFGSPTPDDDDSVLAAMVGVVRWHGFRINVEGMNGLREKAQATIDAAPVNVNAPARVRAYLEDRMDVFERASILQSTSKKVLKKIAPHLKFVEDGPCSKCEGAGCLRCHHRGHVTAGEPHPAAVAIKQILGVRAAKKEVELYDKLLAAGRFHASFNVIGTLSSRMSGANGLNPQAIKSTKEVRKQFPLAWDGYVLCGGDFDSFEPSIADAVYNDPTLRSALLTLVECHKCKGTGQRADQREATPSGSSQEECESCDGTGQTTKKIHALFACELHPELDYAGVMATDGMEPDVYKEGKVGFLGTMYGGNHTTLMKNLDTPEDIARATIDRFMKKYLGIFKARQRVERDFCSIRQPGGIGTAIYWNDPKEYVESFLGFRRYFTLENKIVKAIFDLAVKPPQWWRSVKVNVVRRDRVQTAGGAVASALYQSAFGLQGCNMRAAANHEIQSVGGEITKRVQRRIWDHQPVGVHPLVVAPMNIHDEIQCVTHPDYVEPVAQTIYDVVESYRPQVPLIGMTWFKRLANWADKKSGADKMKICPPELKQSSEAPVASIEMGVAA